MNMKAILSAINTTLAVMKIRPEKYSFIYESHIFELRFKYMTEIPIFSIAQIYNSRTGLNFLNFCSSSVYYCEDRFHIHDFQ